MVVENIDVKGEVTLKLVNRKTGKVEKEVKVKNAMGSDFIFKVFQRILASSEEASFEAANRIRLLNPEGSIIKDLTGEWGAITSSPPTYYRKLTASDPSTDTYTVKTLFLRTAVTGLNYFRQVITEVTKGSDQTLTVEWTITMTSGF
jgi:hypothetical protein